MFAENPVAASGQSAAADSIPANRSAGNGLAATVLYAAERRGRANVDTMGWACRGGRFHGFAVGIVIHTDETR